MEMLEYQEVMERARLTNKSRDRADMRNGHLSPWETPISSHIETATMAIQAGMLSGDVNCVAEGLAMLEEVQMRMAFREEIRP